MSSFSERVEYEVHVHRDTDGSLWADVPELPGCFASGGDIPELQANLVEALGLYLSTPDTTVEMRLEAMVEVETYSKQRLAVCV